MPPTCAPSTRATSSDPGELVVSGTRANDAEESIWGGRLTFTGYDSDTAGTKTVTGLLPGCDRYV